ncbi:helix-turn-helix transcriptional regulator [Roseateles sp. BYS180W]|uniref:Helix-turn-helix transcriptional regulator n=1 Tax=Roseateles rivi TaxID=3299028 RepID=A0ABW7FY10_9BURK
MAAHRPIGQDLDRPTAGASSRLVKLPEVMNLTALSRSSVYAKMKQSGPDRFPACVAVGGRAVAWRLVDVLAWIDSRQAKAPAS